MIFQKILLWNPPGGIIMKFLVEKVGTLHQYFWGLDLLKLGILSFWSRFVDKFIKREHYWIWNSIHLKQKETINHFLMSWKLIILETYWWKIVQSAQITPVQNLRNKDSATRTTKIVTLFRSLKSAKKVSRILTKFHNSPFQKLFRENIRQVMINAGKKPMKEWKTSTKTRELVSLSTVIKVNNIWISGNSI